MRRAAGHAARLGLVVLSALAAASVDAQVADDDCLVLPGESDVGKALRGIRFSAETQSRPLRDIRITGLRRISEGELWRLFGGKPAYPTAENAAALLRHITRLGVFDAVDIAVDVDGGGSVVEFRLREQPVLHLVTIEGLGEASRKEVLEALIADPPTGDVDGCPVGPPRRWVAHVSDGELQPGVLWNGLAAALERVRDHLYDEGFEMSGFQGELASDGTLRLRVDEGRIAAVELHGLRPEVEEGVRKRLGLEPGQVFATTDLESGVKRVREEYPFLEKQAEDRWTRSHPEVVVEKETGGAVRFSTRDTPCDPSAALASPRPGCRHPSSYYSIDGRKLEVHFKPVRGSGSLRFAAEDLLRLTRVNGYAPGVSFEGNVYDPRNRVHLGVDAGLSVNTGRGNRPTEQGGFFESMSAGERFDWYLGPRLRLPALRVAEAGIQLHALTDSSDYWRRAPLDVYLSSLFGSGSGVDFHRRAGITTFASWRVEDLTLGFEHRLDRYDSLQSLSGQVENTPVDAGRMGSLLFRLEWSSGHEEARGANPWRGPETRLYGRGVGPLRTGIRTLNTLELARPGLGGDARFDFTRFVSDNLLVLAASEDHGLLLRLRAAGGARLPPQKQEALGGWSALRGFDYKEFRGDYSLLTMAEYRFDWVSAFADFGTVKWQNSWRGVKVGLGVALNAGDWAQLAFAWRTDARSEGSPKIRLIFQRSF